MPVAMIMIDRSLASRPNVPMTNVRSPTASARFLPSSLPSPRAWVHGPQGRSKRDHGTSTSTRESLIPAPAGHLSPPFYLIAIVFSPEQIAGWGRGRWGGDWERGGDGDGMIRPRGSRNLSTHSRHASTSSLARQQRRRAAGEHRGVATLPARKNQPTCMSYWLTSAGRSTSGLLMRRKEVSPAVRMSCRASSELMTS